MRLTQQGVASDDRAQVMTHQARDDGNPYAPAPCCVQPVTPAGSRLHRRIRGASVTGAGCGAVVGVLLCAVMTLFATLPVDYEGSLLPGLIVLWAGVPFFLACAGVIVFALAALVAHRMGIGTEGGHENGIGLIPRDKCSEGQPDSRMGRMADADGVNS